MSQPNSAAGDRRWKSFPNRNKALVVGLLGFWVAGWTFSVLQQSRNAARLHAFGADVYYRHGNVVGITFKRGGNPFRNAEMPMLQGLPYLETLDLQETKVTKAGLAYLHDMPKLSFLTVGAHQMSSEEKDELAAALPHVAIQLLHTVGGMKVVDGYQ